MDKIRTMSGLHRSPRRLLIAILTLTFVAWGGLKIWQRFEELDRPDWHGIDFASMEEVQLLQEYIAQETTSGKELAGAEWLARILRQHGIEPQMERLATGQANLWAVIEGRRPEALVLHHHIDVFPAVSENWDTPPFEGRILGPLIAGRGTFDMKSYGIAQMLAFLDVAASGVQPEYSLILLATSDEETGSRLGTKWFLREHPEIVERSWTVLTEGGVTESFEEGVVRYWGVEVGQMQWVQISVCAPNRQRLDDLNTDLRNIPRAGVGVPPEVAETLKSLAGFRRQPIHVDVMAQPERLLYDQRRVDALPFFVRLLLQERVNPSSVQELENGFVSSHLAIRQPNQRTAWPHGNVDDLIPGWMMTGVNRSAQFYPGPNPSTTNHAVFETLTRRLAARGGESGPYLLSYVGTDGREFRSHDITTYGYSPFAFVAAGMMQNDRPNERILLTSYVNGVAEYRDAVREIVSLAGSH